MTVYTQHTLGVVVLAWIAVSFLIAGAWVIVAEVRLRRRPDFFETVTRFHDDIGSDRDFELWDAQLEDAQ